MRVGMITTVGTLAAVLAGLMPVRPGAAAVRNEPAPVNYHQWDSRRAFLSGTSEGVRTGPRGLVISRPSGTVQHIEPGLGTTRGYEYARWTSANYAQGFGATQLIASWNAETPTGHLAPGGGAGTHEYRCADRRGTPWGAGRPATATSTAPACLTRPTPTA